MFLNYRIYKLENKIDGMSTRHRNIESHVESDDVDAQAYLKLLNEDILERRKKLDKLKAQRYRDKLNHPIY